MPVVSAVTNGLATRLKRKQRGFHFDRAPGFYGVKDGFDAAARNAGNMAKSASLHEARLRGMRAAAAKLALLDQFDEPIEALAKRLAQSNFGYDGPVSNKDPKYQGFAGDDKWGKPTSMPDGQGDYAGASKQITNRSV